MRLTIIPTVVEGRETNNLALYGLRWFGGYPGTYRRTIYSWDSDKNVTIPAALKAPTVYDNGQRVYSPSNKPTPATLGAAPTSHTHTKAQITDFPASLPANGGTASKVSNKLTVGSKTYDGSAAVTVTAADVGAAAASHTHKAVYTATLTAAGWSASAPYTQTVSVSGITASDTPIADVVLSSTAATAISQQDAWGYVSKITTAANSITVTCLEEKPTINIPIRLMAIR